VNNPQMKQTLTDINMNELRERNRMDITHGTYGDELMQQRGAYSGKTVVVSHTSN